MAGVAAGPSSLASPIFDWAMLQQLLVSEAASPRAIIRTFRNGANAMGASASYDTSRSGCAPSVPVAPGDPTHTLTGATWTSLDLL